MATFAMFDLDDTLIARTEAFGRWAADFGRQRGLSAEDVAWLIDRDGRNGQTTRTDLFTAVRNRFGLDDSVTQLWDRYRDEFPSYVECLPQTLDALTALRAGGWRVGIVTNGRTDSQTAKIRHTGLDRYVDGWAISQTEGSVKPEPGIFEAAANRLGVSLSDGGWMVGDNLHADISGGRGVGLSTIWMHLGRELPEGEPRPTHTASTPAEAVALILG